MWLFLGTRFHVSAGPREKLHGAFIFCNNGLMRIYVRVTPHSSANKIEQIGENEYKVRLTAPPVDNRANICLTEVLSDYFDRPKSSFKIVAGKTARVKIVDF